MSYKNVHQKKKKELMLKALHENCGLISKACKQAKIARQTHYDWINSDDEYKKQIMEIKDYVLDVIEESSINMIKEGKTPVMNIFYLKCLGKDRGFKEKQEIEISTGDMTSLRNIIRECDSDEEHERDY